MDASKIKNSGGYSLIEVMVAMVISLIVLSGVYRVITDETVRAAREEAVLDMQNNARAAMTRISADLRRTGFFGCGGKQSYPAADHTFSAPIVHVNDDAANNNIDNGTDTITLAFLGGDVPLAPGSVDGTSTSSSYFKLGRAAFVNGDELLVTDCEEYAVFTKTNGSSTTPSATVEHVDLNRVYGLSLPARVYSFEEPVYRVDGAKLRLNGEEVAVNIEDLQFEFIEDLNQNRDLTDDGDIADPDGWRDDFTNVAEVRAVRVWVLAMSDTAYSYTDNNTYNYPNSKYPAGSPPNDNRYRYLASATIYLRNAGIL